MTSHRPLRQCVSEFPEGKRQEPTDAGEPISHDWDIQDKCHRCGDRGWNTSASCKPTQQPPADERGAEASLEVTGRSDFPGYVICVELNGYGATLGDKLYTAPKPAPDVAGLVEALEQGFPLLSDEGLDEVEHHCEWVIQRERKRLHSILAAHRKGGEA